MKLGIVSFIGNGNEKIDRKGEFFFVGKQWFVGSTLFSSDICIFEIKSILILMKKQKTEMKISWKLWQNSTIRLREQYAQSRHIIRLRHLRYMHSAFTKWQKEIHCAHKRSWIAKNSELLISNKKNQEQIEEAKNAIQLMHPQLIMQSQSLRDLKSEKLQIEQELQAKLIKKNIKAAEEVAKLQKINAKLCEQLTSKASRLRLFTLWNNFQKRNVKMALRLFLWKWRVSSHKSLTSTSTSESVSVNGVQISHHALRNVRSMIQRLSQSLVMEEFFDAVRVSISQCVAHGAGILLLLDPCRQQLWHIHAKRTIQIPSVFGIAGNIYGVLQIVYPFTSARTKASTAHGNTDYEAQIFGRICASYVESVLEDLLRNVTDGIRARRPEQLIRLFQMQKRWPKHYLTMEKKTRDIKLRYEAMKKQQQRQQQVFEESTAPNAQLKEQNSKLDRVIESLYTKIKMLKEKLHEQQAVLQSKDRQLQGLQASREKMMHLSSRSQDDMEEKWEHRSSILHAEILNLKNQLVRTEADNLLLVKAVSIVLSERELPQSLSNEVQRITQRID
ncbi:hypothetical protein ABG067_005190 [Albugo candida]